MYKPTVPYTPHIYKNYQNRFGGYNHTSACGEGEIYDMKNIGHEEFPVLTPRRGRNTAPAFDNGRIFPAYSETEIVRPEIVGIYSFDEAYVLEKGTTYDDQYGLTESSTNKYIYLKKENIKAEELINQGNNYQIVSAQRAFGYKGLYALAYVNKYIAQDAGDIFRRDIKGIVDSINTLTEMQSNGQTFKIGDLYGVLTIPAYGKTDFDIDGALDESSASEMISFYEWNGTSWEKLANRNPDTRPAYAMSFRNGTYMGEQAEANTLYFSSGFPEWIQVGDGITIAGCVIQPLNNKTVVVKEISEDRTELRFYENTFTLVDELSVNESAIIVSRDRPQLDYMCQCNNRLFGCKGDTIYASKLGDPYNWNVFEGISTDSYSVEVGSSGDFTGCYAYEGDVLFFKEERIYKLLYTDSSPENWALVEIETYGVKAGCDRSLAVADSRLFWYSPKGMVQYGGSLPVSIAEPFGEEEYINAVAGSDGKDYYVCLTDKAGVPTLFVFDTTHNIWFKHDNINVKSFVYHKGDLTALIEKDNGDAEVIRIGQKQPETPIDGEWNDMESMIEFGDTLYETADKKNKMNLFAVAEVEEGGELKFYLSTDGGEYQLVGEIKGKCKKQIHRFSNVPVRCDYYRIKVEGKGMWKIHAISNGYVPGSDI